MIPRNLKLKCEQLAKQYPVIALLGPRQSGKTTLAMSIFSAHEYVTLEDLDIREFAKTDPRRFLKTFQNKKGVILDEIQHVPDLLSYIQTYVDQNPVSGAIILTGSQNFLIHQAISQTLAGRIAILTLLPLSIEELNAHHLLANSADDLLFTGFYPRIYAKKLSPAEWYTNYVSTYVEKDVRMIKNIPDLLTFQRFLKLCAGRIGQLVNFSSLGNDCGIDQRTVKSWLSILEMSYIIFLLPPHFENFSKRLVKMPKIYFYDPGLACSLLGIDSVEQVKSHYLRGGLFESMIISDFIKQKYNAGVLPRIYFWRDKHGHEVDCIIEQKNQRIPIEIKSGQTISSDYFDALSYWNTLAKAPISSGYIVYSGEEKQEREKGTVISWKKISSIFE